MPIDLTDLPTPAALVFDLDGTLVDSVGARIGAWLDVLERAGFPTTHERVAPLIGVDGTRLAHEIAAIAGRPIDDAQAEELDRLAGERYEEMNSAPQPLPGVGRLIDVLEDRGISWAIVTSSRKEQVAASVEALGLAREPRIIDANHVENAKPEPDLLLLAAQQIGIDPSRCWYIGDSAWDMVSAIAAGMIAIGVTAGAAVDAAALNGAGATAVVDRLSCLADALAEN